MAPVGTIERKRAAAYAREDAKRARAHDHGCVTIGEAADELDVGRQILKRLSEEGILPGQEKDGTVWLERAPLDAYVASRPRCSVDGCDRPALGDNRVCSRHSRRRKPVQGGARDALGSRAQTVGDLDRSSQVQEPELPQAWPVVHGLSRRGAAQLLHARVSQRADKARAGGKPAPRKLIAGQAPWRERKMAELDAIPPAAVPQLVKDIYPALSVATVEAWIRAGLLPALQGPRSIDHAVSRDTAVAFVKSWVAGGDWRRQWRHKSPRRRAEWYEHRFGKTDLWGLLAPLLAERVGRTPMKRVDGSRLSAKELEQVARLIADPAWSYARIAIRFGVSRDQVKRFAKKRGETPPAAA